MKALFTIVITLILINCWSAMPAENNDFYTDYLISYPQTILTAMESPLHWESTDWIKAGSILMVGSVIYLSDETINAKVNANRNEFTHHLAEAGNLVGNGRYTVPMIALTWFGGYVYDSPKTQDTALLSLKSFFIANSVSVSLKLITQRYRPNRHKGNSFWNGDKFSRRKDAFPSGHTTIAWSIAPILAEQYKDIGWVTPVVYSVAGITSYARIHDEKHWATDVYAGALIGYFTSQLVLKTTPSILITPSIETSGVVINWQF